MGSTARIVSTMSSVPGLSVLTTSRAVERMV